MLDGETLAENPARTQPDWVPEMIRLWLMCRPGGMLETQRLPDAGGVADQSPFVMECLAILDGAVKVKEEGGDI